MSLIIYLSTLIIHKLKSVGKFSKSRHVSENLVLTSQV